MGTSWMWTSRMGNNWMWTSWMGKDKENKNNATSATTSAWASSPSSVRYRFVMLHLIMITVIIRWSSSKWCLHLFPTDYYPPTLFPHFYEITLMVVTARKCWCINSPPGLRQKTYWFHDWYFDQEGCSQKKPLEESDWMEGLYKIYFPSGQRPQLFQKVSSHFWQILQSGCYCEKNLSQPLSGPLLAWLASHNLVSQPAVLRSFIFSVSGEKFTNFRNLTNHTFHTAAIHGNLEGCFSHQISQVHSTCLWGLLRNLIKIDLNLNYKNDPINPIDPTKQINTINQTDPMNLISRVQISPSPLSSRLKS